jgi:hypothetical protein
VTIPVNPHEEPGMSPMEFIRLQEELQKRNTELAAVNAALRETEGQLERHVEERTRELSTLLRVSHNITTTLELEPLLGLILDQLREVVEYQLASISILENEDELLLLAARGVGMPQPGTRFPLSEHINTCICAGSERRYAAGATHEGESCRAGFERTRLMDERTACVPR